MTVFMLDRENFQEWLELVYRCMGKGFTIYRILDEEELKKLSSIQSVDRFYLNEDGQLLFFDEERMRKMNNLFEKQEGFRKEGIKIDEQLRSLMICLHGSQLFDDVSALRGKNQALSSESNDLSNEIAGAMVELKILKKLSGYTDFRVFFNPEQGTSKIFHSPEIGRTVLSKTAFFLYGEHIMESGDELSLLGKLYQDYSSFVDKASSFDAVTEYVAGKAKKLGYTDLKSFMPFLADFSKYEIRSKYSDVFTTLPKLEIVNK